ncbi:protein containing Sua5/YciO/YrdC [mine drainage metagenome]|uniref:L-threonylcarbamoyladenylate synthase n=1 Tax=mine drainage metagenome TaxID=410659 RepID=T0ZSQ5_9ZZZZ
MAEAVAALRCGEVIGLPTETVYGLAADAGNAQAVARVFALKQRPADHPLIVHLGSVAQLDHGRARCPRPRACWPRATGPGH